MWTIFESLYWICCFCSVLLFWPRGMWDLCSPSHGSNSHPCIGRWCLNHRTNREVPSQNSFARHLASRKRIRVKIRIKLREKEPETLELGHNLGNLDTFLQYPLTPPGGYKRCCCWQSLSGVCSTTPWTIHSPWHSPGQNIGGGLSLLQGIFPTQRSNPCLPHCRRILYQLSHQGKDEDHFFCHLFPFLIFSPSRELAVFLWQREAFCKTRIICGKEMLTRAKTGLGCLNSNLTSTTYWPCDLS